MTSTTRSYVEVMSTMSVWEEHYALAKETFPGDHKESPIAFQTFLSNFCIDEAARMELLGQSDIAHHIRFGAEYFGATAHPQFLIPPVSDADLDSLTHLGKSVSRILYDDKIDPLDWVPAGREEPDWKRTRFVPGEATIPSKSKRAKLRAKRKKK